MLARFKGLKEKYPYYWVSLYFVFYMIWFAWVESRANLPYHVIHFPLDDYIPFCEYFIVPYCMWHPLLFLMTIYLAFYDVETFRKYMWFVLAGLVSAIVVCWIFPNGQDLRPAEFPRHNVFTWMVSRIYAADTNTNVCPSMHVIGCVGLVAACCESPGLRRRHLQWVMIPLGVLICISTVFVKQHSILDMFVAIPYSVVAWLVSFQPWKRKKA